ncbi:MAG: DUF3618 domain-containing protein [Propionibacteriaceae bacterium]|nr:DUF3618 domain-containing protein [Propionibacteriaceae bacterium]
MAGRRTVEQIEADLEVSRQRLADNLSQLVTEIHPKAVVHRTIEETKRTTNHAIADGVKAVKKTTRKVVGYFKDESGWKPSAVAAASVVTVVVIALVVLNKK